MTLWMPYVGASEVGKRLGLQRLTVTLLQLFGFGISAASTLAWRARGGRELIHARLGDELAYRLSSLGGVYVKFGQILATRADLLPPRMVLPLVRLLDDAPPEPYSVSVQTLCRELGLANLHDAFSDFDPTPIGSGSFATVYRATLLDGRPVAVKIRRADIAEQVRTDLRGLRIIAALLDSSLLLGRFRLKSFVASFASWTWHELDYAREAANIDRLSDLFRGHPIIHIPRVHRRYSNSAVLVTTLLTGIWFTEILRQPTRSPRIRRLAYELFETFYDQVFRAGFFHADPHPGNFCLTSDGRIGVVDFGLCSSAEEFRDAEIELLYAIGSLDFARAFDAILRLTHVPPDANLDEIRRNLADILLDWSNTQHDPRIASDERNAAALLRNTFTLMYTHGVMFRKSASGYYRAVYILDGLISQLNPGFNYPRALRKYFRESDAIKVYVALDQIGAQFGVLHFSRKAQAYLRSFQTRREPMEHYFDWQVYRLHRLASVLSKLLLVSSTTFLATLPLLHLLKPLKPLIAGLNVPVFALIMCLAWGVLRLLSRFFWVRAYNVDRWIARASHMRADH